MALGLTLCLLEASSNSVAAFEGARTHLLSLLCSAHQCVGFSPRPHGSISSTTIASHIHGESRIVKIQFTGYHWPLWSHGHS